MSNHRMPGALPIELVLTVVSVTLLAILVFIWWGEYRRTRARFTLGLLAFASVFLVRELLSVLIVLDRADRVPVIGPGISLIVTFAQVVALGLLLYLVSR